MARCKNCGGALDWAIVDGKWTPLEPLATHADLDRKYEDENGRLRADHRDRCGGAPLTARRLRKKVKAGDPRVAVADAAASVEASIPPMGWHGHDDALEEAEHEAELASRGMDQYGSLDR